MQREEQGDYRQHGDAVLRDPEQVFHYARGPVGRFLLGAMQRVVILRVLVVFQVDVRRLRVQDIVDVVRDELCLRLADQPGERAEAGAEECHKADQANEQRDACERDGLPPGFQSGGYGVDYQLHSVERDEGQHALGNSEQQAGNRPARPAPPDQP